MMSVPSRGSVGSLRGYTHLLVHKDPTLPRDGTDFMLARVAYLY
jgi:hypothetical protein